MCFRVSQAPSRYCGLVFAVCFQDLLQQRLIRTYCASSCRRAVYFWKQDSQSRRRTSNHWRACRSSTLYAVCTSNLSNRVVQWIQLLASSIVPTMRWYYNEIHFSICIAFIHLQLQGFSASASPRNRACVTRPSPLVGGVWAQDYLSPAPILPPICVVTYTTLIQKVLLLDLQYTSFLEGKVLV